jgi:putative ABC transport system substrate-binding protein
VRLNVDVIVAANNPAGLAAKNATKTIPIVIATMEEPVQQGFAASLANPGSNITGRSVETDPMEATRRWCLGQGGRFNLDITRSEIRAE